VRHSAALTNELLPLQFNGVTVAVDSAFAVASKSCESFNPMNPNSDTAPLSVLHYSVAQTDRQTDTYIF
jgi:hypothetical protein